MKNKELYKLLKKNKSNAGFTLTELLVGLFMSIFVIGALGFGLMQVLQSSKTEGSKTSARNETGRALDFISDELRRAQAIEVNMSSTYLATTDNAATTLINEEVAPNFTLPTGGTVRLALQIPGVKQRVIYFVAPPESTSPWKGPLVIYRWGPELMANGSYVTDPTSAGRVNNPAGWSKEALIDKIDNTTKTQACGGANQTYQGFFACIVDNDGDSVAVTENLTDTNSDGKIDSQDTGATDKNGDGAINDEDGADVDGKAITAQLYFTGDTITVSGTDTGYSANTQTVARARTAPENKSEELNSYTWSIKGLGGKYNCSGDTTWDMQTSFDALNSSDEIEDPTKTVNWTQTTDNNKQPRPIDIDPSKPLKITSDPINGTNCNNIEDPISVTIDFGDPKTFNGDCVNTATETCTTSNYNNPRVSSVQSIPGSPFTSNEKAQFFKQGYTIPQYGGYLGDPTTTADDQPTLGKFLYDKGLAIPVTTGADVTLLDTVFKIPTKTELDSFLAASTLSPAEQKRFQVLEKDQRIIAFEAGQLYRDKKNNGDSIAGDINTGFDLQDNIFIVTSKVFEKTFAPTLF